MGCLWVWASSGSTCWGREEGSAGQSTPAQAACLPPFPGARPQPQGHTACEACSSDPLPFPASPAAQPASHPGEWGKPRQTQLAGLCLASLRATCCLPGVVATGEAATVSGPLRCRAHHCWDFSCLPPPPFSSFKSVLSFESFPHPPSHPTTPWEIPEVPSPATFSF